MEKLRSALSRINSASEWADQAKLFNISSELKRAAKDVREYILSQPAQEEQK